MQTPSRTLALFLLSLGACSRDRAPSPAPAPEKTAAAPPPMADPLLTAAALVPRIEAPPLPTATATIAAAPPPPGMLLVPGGTFTMGQDKGGQEDEHPAHTVTLSGFWLDQTEVTYEAYQVCVDKGACKPPEKNVISKFGGLFIGPKRPVTGVSWFDSRAYCTFMGKRLPREAEFERAVRGDDGRRFPWGSETPTHDHTVFHTNTTDVVGSRPKGRGPYGHDDLAGNVWEWMEDDYDPIAYTREGASKGVPGNCDEIKATLQKLHREGRQGFTGSNPLPTDCEKSIRGGAYNYDADGLRSTNRVHHPGNFKLLMTGMRCAKDL
ncbi:MAG: SUMF1/EgtB/PvdO family nonheme iron enzyme [Polyangiaceae bacterium]